jgi:hypothetical protein
MAIGTAKYNYELVIVLDVISTPSGDREYLINYGGPIWVKEDELSNIIYGE